VIDNPEDMNEERESVILESPKKLIIKIKEEILKVMTSKLGELNSLSAKCKTFLNF